MFSSSPHFYSLCVCTVSVASFATLSSPSWLQLIYLTCRPAHLPSIYSSTQQYFKPSSSPTCRWIIVLTTVDHQPSVSLPACNFLASTLSPSATLSPTFPLPMPAPHLFTSISFNKSYLTHLMPESYAWGHRSYTVKCGFESVKLRRTLCSVVRLIIELHVYLLFSHSNSFLPTQSLLLILF